MRVGTAGDDAEAARLVEIVDAVQREELEAGLTRVLIEVERARADGYLRPDVEATDMPILGLLAGTVSEWAGHVDPELWRRYVALLLDGMRHREGQPGLRVHALKDEQMDAAMRGWHPAGSPS